LVDSLDARCYNKSMKRETVNEALQWTGTGFILAMYVLMSYFPELHPWNIVCGLFGGLCYFTWTVRVANKPQMLVNVVAIVVCAGGLIRAFS
jgi:hypothetical protein